MKNIFKILSYSKHLWPYYAVISFFTILLSLLTLLQPLFSGWAIDEITKGTDANVKYVVWLAIGIFVLDLMGTLFSNINGYIGDLMHAQLTKFLSAKYYSHLLKLPQSYYDNELSGKIINRLNRSIMQITNFMHMMSNNFLQFIFSTVFSLAIVFYYSWQVGLLLLSLYPIYIFLTLRTSNRWLKFQEKKNIQSDLATGRFSEVINQLKVVKSFNQEAREKHLFNKYMDKYIAIDKPQSADWHKKDVERRIILNLIFLGVYLFIFVQGARGLYSPGVAVALILYAMQIRMPIFTISYLVENTQKAIADSKDYFDIMNKPLDKQDIADSPELRIDNGQIEFDDVSFGYSKKHVLDGLKFVVEPNSKVALVGESGEGKTTITNLLIRLYRPKSGHINIDGQNINDVSLASLRHNIAVVFQEPALFSGTIYENIAYGNPKADKNMIEQASKMANAHIFISKFDKGYQSQIGERGLKLSGGQKQRIAIARAILKNAPILVLDEATSSLDSQSESLVQQALDRLMAGKTTIIIAHRLSTIAGVDKIITLKNGKVDEYGSPEELAQSGGVYSQLLAISSRHDKKAQTELKNYDIKQS